MIEIGDSNLVRRLKDIYPSIGADPEFFIMSIKGKKIIESNKILPKGGLLLSLDKSRCTIDGVQAEINPSPRGCRQGAGEEYKRIFNKLALALSEKKVTMCLKSMIHFTQEELDELSDDSKKFGCAPSINYYTNKESVITANPDVYGHRSAGGHIHLGANEDSKLFLCIREKPKLIIRLLDLVLGNTCVMLDRDPNQKERRTVYGRAGEYRLPTHGIEYRTLSNFWIKNYHLMDMVYGFARLGLCIAYNIFEDERNYPKTKSSFREVLKASNKKDVQKAINNNDFDLAKRNWDEIKHILVSMIPSTYFNRFPINVDHLDAFEHFIDKGLDYWFKDDLLTHWTERLTCIYRSGWESFLRFVVTADMENNGNIEWSIGSNGLSVVVKRPIIEMSDNNTNTGVLS